MPRYQPKLTLGFASLLAILFMVPSQAYARGGGFPNCKSDKILDVPMPFVVDVQSAGRVHLSASGGSDKSGAVFPLGWHLFDSSGTQIDYFPTSDLGFASQDMLKETNLEGLVPGATYVIQLVSSDLCGHQGFTRQVVTMPQATPEFNPPVLSAPTLVRTGIQVGQFTAIQFSVTDNTGIQDVTISINDTVIQEFKYFDGATFRWWCVPYAADGVQSTLEGPNFYVYYPDSYKNQSALVEVVAVDLFGNRSVTSAILPL
jgi:hypothetical protein